MHAVGEVAVTHGATHYTLSLLGVCEAAVVAEGELYEVGDVHLLL